MKRWDIINTLIKKNGYKTYLEIGVRDGGCFEKIKAEYKDGVDPNPIRRAIKLVEYKITSDVFFSSTDRKWDIIFIDGLHECEQVLRDIKNSLKHLNQGGAIVCHDMSPQTEVAQITPSIVEPWAPWNGDCWKAWVRLRCKGGLSMYVVDTDHGCGIIEVDNSVKPLKIKEQLTYANLDKNRRDWLNLISKEIWQADENIVKSGCVGVNNIPDWHI